MSEFELITITFSFVLGLGIAQILSAASGALRNRRRRPLHWLPLAMAASIFLLHIQYWFVLFDFDANVIGGWTWGTYGIFLGLAVVLFLSGGVVLPSQAAESRKSMIDDFEGDGKFSLLLLVAYLIGWVPVNAWGTGNWFSIPVWFNIGLTIPLMITYYASNRTHRNVAAIVYLVALVVGLLFVWSTPTDAFRAAV